MKYNFHHGYSRKGLGGAGIKDKGEKRGIGKKKTADQWPESWETMMRKSRGMEEGRREIGRN